MESGNWGTPGLFHGDHPFEDKRVPPGVGMMQVMVGFSGGIGYICLV